MEGNHNLVKWKSKSCYLWRNNILSYPTFIPGLKGHHHPSNSSSSLLGISGRNGFSHLFPRPSSTAEQLFPAAAASTSVAATGGTAGAAVNCSSSGSTLNSPTPEDDEDEDAATSNQFVDDLVSKLLEAEEDPFLDIFGGTQNGGKWVEGFDLKKNILCQHYFRLFTKEVCICAIFLGWSNITPG